MNLWAWLDPIKMIDDLYTTSRNGRGVLIEWDANVHTGAEVESFLRSYGVACYARKYPAGGVAGCHVRKRQAAFADGLLRGAGFAVLSKQLSKPITPRTQWGVPAKAQGFGGLVGDALGVMDSVNRRNRERRRRERKERY